jgi:excinuclease UvrABC ATPase subunit
MVRVRGAREHDAARRYSTAATTRVLLQSSSRTRRYLFDSAAPQLAMPSGGEAQRIKLATELQRAQRGGTLYVLDEPTTGLQPEDVEKLTAQLDGLVESGNTVIVVEHDMRVVAASDWVIDIGPGAGEEGGRIVAAGPPAAVAPGPGRTVPYLARFVDMTPGSYREKS